MRTPLIRLISSGISFTLFALGGILCPGDAAPPPVAAALPAPGELPPAGSFRKSIFFEVAAADAVSATFVATLARELEATLAGLFRGILPTNSDGPRNIRIELLSAKDAPWPEPWRIVEKRGQWLLLLRWAPDTQLDTVRHVLARTLLARLVQNHSGDTAGQGHLYAPAFPRWFVEAFLSVSEIRAAPALMGIRALEARDAGPAPLDGLDGAPRRSFWFLLHLQRELIRKGISGHTFFSGLAAGGSPEEIFARHFPEEAADADRRALWWPTGFTQLTHARRSGTVLTMRESREYLEKAIAFVFAPAGVDRRFSAEDLPTLSHLPAVQSEVRLRAQRLRRDISAANPVWHNAWQSYGLFLEKFPGGNVKELQGLWKQVQVDVQAARVLEGDVNTVLKTQQ
jgi:hypothetical protein